MTTDATDLTCAEVNAKANACSMVVDTLQEYEPLEKYLLHLRGERRSLRAIISNFGTTASA